MVEGMDIFKEYFKGYEDQYVLIGGAACDVLFTSNHAVFRVTRDLDMVLIAEELSSDFGKQFWRFIADGKYRSKCKNGQKPQFYRFDKPENSAYPKMIELFSRTDTVLKEMTGTMPIHIDDEIASLSAILLDADYYQALLNGRILRNGLSVLKPEYMIVFKAKAYIDLRSRKNAGESVDASSIRKHKKDILRISAELMLNKEIALPDAVRMDMNQFMNIVKEEPFDSNLLKEYRLTNKQVIDLLQSIFVS